MPSDAHNNITRFEIAVDKVARMDVLQATELSIVDISPSSWSQKSNALTNCLARSDTVLIVNLKQH